MSRRIAIFCIIFIFCFGITAYAHKPIFEKGDSSFNNPIVVPDHRISYAVYGKISNTKDIDFIKFNARKGDTFYIEATIPVIKKNQSFKPYIALIGPGLINKDKVPFDVPKNYGVIEFPPNTYQYFYEKFTQTSYYEGQSIRGEIPVDGSYYVAVYSYDSRGKYSIAIGEIEKFGLKDIAAFPFTYFKVKYFFSPVKSILIIIFAFIIISGIIYLYRIWKKPRGKRYKFINRR